MKNLFNTSISWPFPTPFKIHVQVEWFTLGFDIYRSVRLIPYKAVNVVQLSRSPGCISETNSLDMPQDPYIIMFRHDNVIIYM
jgi:hypothetical protein